jgi:peptidylprolyl isomerase
MTRRVVTVVGMLLAAALAGCTLKDEGMPEVPRDVAGPPPDALKTSSGLASKVLRVGLGDRHPAPTSEVKVHYSGWTTKGELFDSSVARNEPLVFRIIDNGRPSVIPGWVEGLQLMVKGEKRRFWIPGPLAYGEDEQHRVGPPGAPIGMLVFDIEMLDIR